MILEELRLHNFCLFRGEHVFNLRPSVRAGTSSPIVLFGGMNGAGKTTLLDAVQLALYGSRARAGNRLGKPYDEYLRESVHRGAAPDEDASVSVSFRYIADGHEQRYEVWRGWSVKEKSVRERVKVVKDDNVDTFLSDNWNDFVEELIPLGISQLFFFDAEKIRFLADDETDTAALGVAIKSLLGLDLAERLIADAAIVEKRLSDSILDQSKNERASLLQLQLEAKSAELTEAKAERAALENPLLRAKSHLEKTNKEFASAGGDHWKQRAVIEAQFKEAESGIADIETELQSLCSAEIPLLLIPNLLRRTSDQDSREQNTAKAEAFHETLVDRDKKVLKQLREAGQTSATIQTLRKLLDEDRKNRLDNQQTKRLLDLSGQSRGMLARMLSGNLDDLGKTANKLLRKLERLQNTREKCLRLLNATPDDKVIAALVERLQDAAATFGKLEGEGRRFDERIDTLRRERDELDKALTTLQRELINGELAHEESLRMARLAQKTQFTMREFLRRATAHKIDHLSGLITHSFRFLLRKQTLVGRVQIHPDTFRIDLLDESGVLLPKSRLSEGEKQIFAIAVLWGLAQAAPRQLPAIIDTPMARLDSEHRQNLVERYFPNASHQVIILSTDTEIEQGYFESLRPRISRSFHLRYSDSEQCTLPELGYFWDSPETAVPAEVAS